jgi:hypothetical protein
VGGLPHTSHGARHYLCGPKPAFVVEAGWRIVSPSLVSWPDAAAALGGAIAGTAIGLRWLSQTATRFALTGILLAAGIQLVFF